MPKKAPTSAKRAKPARKRVKKPVSDATRAADEVLRESLRTADFAKFDRVLVKAIRRAP